MTPPLTIEQVPSADLGADRMDEVRRLCDAAYSEASGPYFEAIGAGVHLLGLREGELVSHLMWVTRWLELGALCPATDGLYLRVGWRYWRGPLFVRQEGSLISTPEERVMILDLPRTPVLNLDAPLSVAWRPGDVW
jgi:aminoglycoside 2'-N-acetyltransferase I